jgi:UDP-N-acetylmuramoylalanine--D-glutamate ligase
MAVTLFCNADEAASLDTTSPEDTPPRVVTALPDAASLSAFDVVIKSPGISTYRPEILEARRNGTRFTSGTALWFAEHPRARVIAVTGTKGKSTTSAMIAHVARALGLRTALAGNIGMPLLELLGEDAALWVIELSSFQTGDAGPVDVGLITNLHEEHLDWHGSREAYAADKLRLAEVARTLVVGAAQPDLLERTRSHPRRIPYGDESSWHCGGRGALCRRRAVMDPEFDTTLPVPGRHNRDNACAALTTLDALLDFDGETALAAARSLAGFRGLPHRLQFVGVRNRCVFVDDSISTTPEATLAGLLSLNAPAAAVIVGGHERGLDWTSFARAVATRESLQIITQGANGPRIAATLRAERVRCVVREAPDLAAAVALAVRLHAPAVLLSPGAPSFDQFRDYAERGRAFAALAGFAGAGDDGVPGLGIA